MSFGQLPSRSLVLRFVQDEHGQDLVEYSLLIALIAVVCAGLVNNVGTGYKNLWTTTSNMLANAEAIAVS
jgi:Flp pilus assembly pilin Flp